MTRCRGKIPCQPGRKPKNIEESKREEEIPLTESNVSPGVSHRLCGRAGGYGGVVLESDGPESTAEATKEVNTAAGAANDHAGAAQSRPRGATRVRRRCSKIWSV